MKSQPPPTASDSRSSGILVLLWAVVLVELLSPIPAFLTVGAIWVLLARPPWFLALVHDLYGIPRPGDSTSSD